MDEETIGIHASNLIMAYQELVRDLRSYVHDPAAHNLCLAVLKGYSANGGSPFEQYYISYSNPKGLPKRLQGKYAATLIPPNNPHGSLFDGAGMAYLHTEVRLLNYLWANRASSLIMPAVGQFYFFSTRSVCGGCAKMIGKAQEHFSSINIALIPFELQAENFAGDASSSREVYMYLAKRGSGGQKREDSTYVGMTA